MSDRKDRRRQIAGQYAHYFETLTLDRAGDIAALLSEDVHFIDPFNDVRGRDQVVRLVEKMFEDVEDPRFDILDLAWTDELCLMRWDFYCNVKVIGAWHVRGMTELQFNEEGLICAHYDYWDSGRHFYGRLPVIGPLLRFLTRKARLGS
ncbi:nuclear transport factor 2 family protein [Cohaesibacter sp. CAU 1516]|uniref:nuclear transport factor 2 family protein n=1 Tax=Cohaesibacter sp. CAU 1516 TaxID=2576038 RepID=UPI0014858456|nr:nuclear transport factor 2 family protein [Cohaesibacter sp. CAU 1516]